MTKVGILLLVCFLLDYVAGKRTFSKERKPSGTTSQRVSKKSYELQHQSRGSTAPNKPPGQAQKQASKNVIFGVAPRPDWAKVRQCKAKSESHIDELPPPQFLVVSCAKCGSTAFYHNGLCTHPRISCRAKAKVRVEYHINFMNVLSRCAADQPYMRIRYWHTTCTITESDHPGLFMHPMPTFSSTRRV